MTDDNLDLIAGPSELELLKKRADLLQISYHPSIGLDTLKVKIAEKVGEEHELPDPTPEYTAPVKVRTAKEIQLDQINLLRREASKLIRIRVNCMNPAKSDYPGEIFSAGNSYVGTHKKYVPFGNEEGYHVPQIILNMMLERECQVFGKKKDAKGRDVPDGKLIKEFAIEIMTPLTEDEIHSLAQRQAMSAGTNA